MGLQLVVIQALAGLASAMFLFLVAAGLSLIFGVSRIVNFAHGSFYMLAAYVTYSLTQSLPSSPWSFWLALLVAPLAIAALGGFIEVALLRRVYRAPEISQLLLTFALVLFFGDAVKYLWGVSNKSVPMPALLAGSVPLWGQPFPVYYLLVIALGPLLMAGLWLLFYRTRFGILVRAATEDREMVAALGEDQARLFTRVFVFGSWLAGLGGTLAAPMVALTPGMDATVIVEAFVVVVVGGMGSFSGSLLAALLIGELQSFGLLVFPRLPMILVFALMAVVLIVRPWGLLGTPPPVLRGESGAAARPPGRSLAGRLGWLAVGLGLVLLPAGAGPFTLLVAVEALTFALFACSLHVLMGYGGMLSFGHAAYFGLGAYGAALWLTRGGLPMPAAAALGTVTAALAAALFGLFCVRLRGIYFSMLTLAFAQVAYTVVFQWYDFTGGDNGLLGVWPPLWLASPQAYYFFTLAVVGGAVWLLHALLRSPFGLTLRAIRDNPRRALTVGLGVASHQYAAFVIAGFFAGVAGVLFAFQKGSVFPDYLFVLKSLEPLVMILLGGMQSFAGPLLGAGLYKLLDTVVTAYVEYWSALLGLILIALVLLCPQGLTGAVPSGWQPWRVSRGH
ncbi:MAG: branched-chain amino acid ABC transporter permease [Candidatus Tectimicrobiota bacterium]|nr:MAG: branched-chain amino acid ABC transporter permease [Candidatus Tectomicrobia bacterium]